MAVFAILALIFVLALDLRGAVAAPGAGRAVVGYCVCRHPGV